MLADESHFLGLASKALLLRPSPREDAAAHSRSRCCPPPCSRRPPLPRVPLQVQTGERIGEEAERGTRRPAFLPSHAHRSYACESQSRRLSLISPTRVARVDNDPTCCHARRPFPLRSDDSSRCARSDDALRVACARKSLHASGIGDIVSTCEPRLTRARA